MLTAKSGDHLTCDWLLTELLRENKRMLDKAIRDLDRERAGLQSQEKKLIIEIKKMAKENQMVIQKSRPHNQPYIPCQSVPAMNG